VSPVVGVGPDVCRVKQLRWPGSWIGAVVRARFQEQDLTGGVLAQPVGKDASRRPRPDDDCVEPLSSFMISESGYRRGY
jgi:hypothetical protein